MQCWLLRILGVGIWTLADTHLMRSLTQIFDCLGFLSFRCVSESAFWTDCTWGYTKSWIKMNNVPCHNCSVWLLIWIQHYVIMPVTNASPNCCGTNGCEKLLAFYKRIIGGDTATLEFCFILLYNLWEFPSPSKKKKKKKQLEGDYWN